MTKPRRAIALVIDALGVGALPDAPDYNDSLTVNTMGNIDASVQNLRLPTLEKLGMGHILPLNHLKPIARPIGYYGKMSEYSRGKDTTTGHWEMMGILLEQPFPTYPHGFPEPLIQEFVKKSGCQGVLGNIPASGTTIIEDLGAKHLETGFPIVYTSADSVFQIACHVDKVPLKTLYQWCEVARSLLKDEHQISRVIARPFHGPVGEFERLGGDRRDYAITPPPDFCLDVIKDRQGIVLGIGKIEDIFCQKGITHAIHTQSNTHGLQVTLKAVSGLLDLQPLDITGRTLNDYDTSRQFIFINLVDTDMKYGHRRDVDGYARALEEIDQGLATLIDTLGPDDLLLITGDHGCDPTAPGSDHTREYVPILMYSPSLPGGHTLGIRESFADLGKTVLDWLNLPSVKQPGRTLLDGTLVNA